MEFVRCFLGHGLGKVGNSQRIFQSVRSSIRSLNSRADLDADLLAEDLAERVEASFFRGDASIFGGIAYQIPEIPLTLLAEYESDQYDREVQLNTLKDPSEFNFALAWQPVSNTLLRVSWLRGDTLGVTLSSQIDTKRKAPRRYEKRTSPSNVDSNTGLPDGFDPDSWYDRMVFESEQSGLYLKQAALRKGERKATMLIENRAYNLTADALNQIMASSELYMPSHVSSIDLILQENGLVGPTVNYSLQRDDFSDADEDDVYRSDQNSRAEENR